MIPLLLGMLLASSQTNDTKAPVTVSSLNERRDEFDGKVVALKGYLWIGPEQLYVLDRKFDNEDAWQQDSGCLSLVNVGDIGSKSNALSGKYVEISGRFVADTSAYGVSLMVCGATGLDLGSHPEDHIKLLEDPARANTK